MPSFKQKNVIKSYKLRLQKKFQAITEETENATEFLNTCLLEFKNRVDQILEIKDEKCLSLYRNLTKDLEKFSEKLFILQDSLEGSNDDSSQNEDESEDTPPIYQEISESQLNTDVEESVVGTPFDAQLNSNESSSSTQDASSLSQLPVLSDTTHIDNKSRTENYFECESVTEDDFCSFQSDSVTHNDSNEELFEIVKKDCESNQSFSQSSCYRSASSNISESAVQHRETEIYQCTQSVSQSNHESQISTHSIPTPVIQVPSKISGTLSFIVNPGDFWIQIESSLGSSINFPMSENTHLDRMYFIKKGDYCLAPFRSSFYYYRAQSLTDAKTDQEVVKVCFLDHGSTREVPLCYLRHLPSSAFDVPAQALHCCLYGIVPVDGSWSEKCIERFKYFQNFCIDIDIKSKERLFAVQLVAKMSEDLNEDFSIDIALKLCIEGFAISENDPSQSVSVKPKYHTSESYPASKITDSSLKLSASYDITATSNDSGVSVTSVYKSSPNISKVKGSRDNISSLNWTDSSCKSKHDFNFNSNNVNSFDSCNSLNLKNTDKVHKLLEITNYLCIMCKSNNFCWHLQIPPAKLFFVEENMMIVMLSYIEDLYEFYVNIAKDSIVNLDDLRDHMTATYNSQRKDMPQVGMEDLMENMFCAGFYEADNHWYRVKILKINSEGENKNQVLVQYVDYGNTATIHYSDLLPLSPEFNQYPVFAVKCSLAGLVPVDNATSLIWNEEAISAFEQLTSFDRCLTAQICSELYTDNDSHAVLLWDVDESKEILINCSLADRGVAIFDEHFVQIENSKAILQTPHESDNLTSWDPMSEDYNDIQNSYAIKDHEDIQVVTSGYKAKDEEYICKYYSLRGYCPRGDNCQYDHLPLLECGVTRDQVEVFCMDILPLLPDNAGHILVQVSTVISPSLFYVILPYGCKTVNEIDNLAKRGSSYEEIENKEAKELFFALDKYYSKAPFQENTGLALSFGTIVVAKRKSDKKFHRGRVIDGSDANRPYKIFFVDSGDSEWVARKFIRTIVPQFLYTPFQAVECCLYGVQPIESDRWQSAAVHCFKNQVSDKILLAEIIHRSSERLLLTLRKTAEYDHRKIDQILISREFAKVCSKIPSAKKECRYVPG